MARIKPKRHGVVTDMTAMCDVTFLLLTFFIMTTQFKKPDVEQIKPPSSISEKLNAINVAIRQLTKHKHIGIYGFTSYIKERINGQGNSLYYIEIYKINDVIKLGEYIHSQ